MVGAGALRAWLRAVQPALAATFIAAPGAMIRATAALACPSTFSWPMVFELMVRVVVLVTSCQPGDTTYQSGSADESTSLSSPSVRSEEHTSELQSRLHLVCRLLLEKKKKIPIHYSTMHPALITSRSSRLRERPSHHSHR